MKKSICLFLAILLTFGLCACTNNGSIGESSTDSGPDTTVPESIVGCWYPSPDAGSGFIEIRKNGTCSIFGEDLAYTLSSRNEVEVVLVAGDHTLTFSKLDSPLPLLHEEIYGICIQYPDLWNLNGEWYCAENNTGFTLDILEIHSWNCEVDIDNNSINAAVLENGEALFYVSLISFGGSLQGEVTDADGNTMLYTHLGSGTVSDDLEQTYQQTVRDLEAVSSGGKMVDYIDADGVSHMISGNSALHKLYDIFSALGDYRDSAVYLSKFDIAEIGSVKIDIYRNGTEYAGFDSLEYDSRGRLLSCDSLPNGQVEFGIYKGHSYRFTYDASGKLEQIQAKVYTDDVSAKPVYDENGIMVAMQVSGAGIEYTSLFTYDDQGLCIQVEMPYDAAKTRTVLYTYDDQNRLIQEKWSGGTGTFDNRYDTVREYYYDGNSALIRTVQHTYSPGNAVGSWDIADQGFVNDDRGNPVSSTQTSATADRYANPAFFDRLFNADRNAPIDYVQQGIVTETYNNWSYTYLYEDLYLYTP